MTGDSDAHLQLARVYLKAGPAELALPELKKALRLDPGNREAERLLADLSRPG
ncbi:MAG TPA: tetratricopeptide repeat protein [Candidatus Polarisedimenticolia bacterium]|nr:tetratricopeptide repeat protein [Candidatus Polarisedimenticolia bacterium]